MSETKQEFRAMHRYAHISPSKVRPVANLVRGLPVNDALNKLRMNHRRGAHLLRKVLESAVANAGQAEDAVKVNRLYVKNIWADQAGLLQGSMRWRPGPMGRAMPIRKRMAHLGVIVAERQDEGEE
jgi:large subunit ribosomal protein L22